MNPMGVNPMMGMGQMMLANPVTQAAITANNPLMEGLTDSLDIERGINRRMYYKYFRSMRQRDMMAAQRNEAIRQRNDALKQLEEVQLQQQLLQKRMQEQQQLKQQMAIFNAEKIRQEQMQSPQVAIPA